MPLIAGSVAFASTIVRHLGVTDPGCSVVDGGVSEVGRKFAARQEDLIGLVQQQPCACVRIQHDPNWGAAPGHVTDPSDGGTDERM